MRALVNLFNCYKEEQITRLDFLERGVALNNSRCQWTLARKLGYGFGGVTPDLKKALDLLKDSQDYTKAQFDIGVLTARLEGSPTIFVNSHKHYHEAGSERGDKRAIEALSSYANNQRKFKVATKLGLIAFKIEGSCIGSENNLLNRIGVYYGGLKDPLTRKKWFIKAIQQGSASAHKNMTGAELF